MPQPLTANNREWLDHNGHKFRYKGKTYKLTAVVREAIFPYKHDSLEVTAEMLDKDCPEYRSVAAQLRDAWVLDVIASDPEVQTKILSALAP